MKDLDTPEETREFLRLCLDPGHGIQRTPDKLAEIMPPQMRDQVEAFAPHLTYLRGIADMAQAGADEARAAYAGALADWIDGKPAPDLAPDTEPRPVVDLATLAEALMDSHDGFVLDLSPGCADLMAGRLLKQFRIQPLPTEGN
ncbi:hypothetical protein ACPCSP_20190 [Streptomyces cinereoruber]|uniref:hypothetical protein n=1 Tax=Streptomyces cinereoruber TaxID=67260 RepID=UPI003C2C5267